MRRGRGDWHLSKRPRPTKSRSEGSMSTATIRLLVIKRFRSVRSLIWRPNPRLNIILGAADCGKSTVLEAIALLFSAAPNFALSEFDYHNRDVDAGFTIQAVLSVRGGAFLPQAS